MEEAVRSNAPKGQGVVRQDDDAFDGELVAAEREERFEDELVRLGVGLDVRRIEAAALGARALGYDDPLLLEDLVREIGLGVMEPDVYSSALPARTGDMRVAGDSLYS